ncbi:hypothetical protein F5876DRAFT_64117 [Lentinula aff. lateritia]|uniref:Uncharacterized protein n=1 Tax=Lentinula aff. lateritia TaxID=2804960 RepID=A0ACC1U5J4_9AGAR|nr:hypothetical protein F5876DRAFT_64117 [Lentinula aff. lateritia]
MYLPSLSPGPPTVASASGLTFVSASTSATPVLPISTETFQRKMHTHIRNIRDFCDGLEYQVQFNDLRMLQELEEKGNEFLDARSPDPQWDRNCGYGLFHCQPIDTTSRFHGAMLKIRYPPSSDHYLLPLALKPSLHDDFGSLCL